MTMTKRDPVADIAESLEQLSRSFNFGGQTWRTPDGDGVGNVVEGMIFIGMSIRELANAVRSLSKDQDDDEYED